MLTVRQHEVFRLTIGMYVQKELSPELKGTKKSYILSMRDFFRK